MYNALNVILAKETLMTDQSWGRWNLEFSLANTLLKLHKEANYLPGKSFSPHSGLFGQHFCVFALSKLTVVNLKG
jgi:hypothetical protein